MIIVIIKLKKSNDNNIDTGNSNNNNNNNGNDNQNNDNNTNNDVNYDFIGTKFINISYANNSKIENTFKTNGKNHNDSIGIINNDTDYESYNDRNIYDLYIPQYAIENKENYNGIILWIHGGAWVQGEKESMNPIIAMTMENGFIIANMGYTLLGEKYKNSNIFRVLDEVSACVQSIVDKLTSEFGFREDRLGIALGGGSAGAHIALLYSYLMKKNSIPIPIKFIINTVGPIGLNTKYFSRLTNQSEPLDNIENLEVLKIAFAQKKIGEYKPTVLFANFMNYFLGKKYSKEFMDSMKINALYVNGSNPNYTLLCDESIYSDITHIKDQRPDCPMICLYAGRDTVAGLAQFAYLNETARGNRSIKFIYSKYSPHNILKFEITTDEAIKDQKLRIKMLNAYIIEYAKKYFK